MRNSKKELRRQSEVYRWRGSILFLDVKDLFYSVRVQAWS